MKMEKENISKGSNVKNKGAGNGRWSGGTGSFYKNHYQLKLNRKEKLKQCNNKCEECGKEAPLIASKIDGNKDNIDISNLRMLCKPCLGPKTSTKFIKLYGMTLENLSKTYGISLSSLYRSYVPVYHDKESMHNALASAKKEREESLNV
jgi:hypothetical protein